MIFFMFFWLIVILLEKLGLKRGVVIVMLVGVFDVVVINSLMLLVELDILLFMKFRMKLVFMLFCFVEILKYLK